MFQKTLVIPNMEENRKRSRGFLKGKIMSFHKEPKTRQVVHQYTTTATNVGPGHASVGSCVSKPKPQVFVLVDHSLAGHVLEGVYGMDGDEGVDGKAASYISSVQKRWKLENE